MVLFLIYISIFNYISFTQWWFLKAYYHCCCYCSSSVTSVVSDSMRPHRRSLPGSLSLGFSRQEHWSGLPFPSPMHESEKWKVKVKSLSRVWLFTTPQTAPYQAPLPMGLSRQEYWSGVPLPSPYEELCLAFAIQWIPFQEYIYKGWAKIY